jgi:Zn-dependent protease
MINEIASSPEDRPVLRSSVRLPDEENAQQIELRRIISAVFVIEDEQYDRSAEEVQRDEIVLASPDMTLVASFTGHLLLDSAEAYEKLDQDLKPINLLPIFRTSGERQVIHVLAGRTEPRPRAVWVNVVLLVATVFSLMLLGTGIAISEIGYTNRALADALQENFLVELWRGIPYAAALLLILGAHELGHYFAARYHRLAVTLPYFIPAPFIGFLGTFGAFIQLREPMRNRRVLLDVGAAGPLVGLVFAIPITIIGLATSPVRPITPGGFFEGNSLLYALMKTVVFGEFLPANGVDVHINQLATAGWAGLLVTALNLIPIGQLDGGHILYALIGRHARKLYYPLVAATVVLAVISSAWILWVVLLLLFGRTYAAPLDTITPLDRRRFWVGALALATFVFIFTPIPATPIEPAATSAPGSSVYDLIPFATAGVILLWQRLRR